MLSMQHIMCAELHGARSNNNQYMAAVVYPDAIRAYSGPRQYSHFEKASDGTGDSSYWKLPADMKAGKEAVQASIASGGHMSYSVKPAAIGELTDYEAFRRHNGHLPDAMYAGVSDHLKQDMAFDDFIREKIDCSGKYEDRYRLPNGSECDGRLTRAYISQIEQHGIYVLAHELYEKKGITADQAWFESRVKPVLNEQYGPELAEKTYSFMKISPEINGLIQAHDWSKLNDGPLPLKDYQELYGRVLADMAPAKTQNPAVTAALEKAGQVSGIEAPDYMAEMPL